MWAGSSGAGPSARLLICVPCTAPALCSPSDAHGAPASKSVCRSIEVDGKPTTLARAGDSADVTLAGVDATAVCSGTVLCHPDFPVPLVDK